MPDTAPSHVGTVRLLHPLELFYRDCPLPRVEEVSSENIPEPQHTLLVGTHDMTPTLEEHHGCPISLEVLERLTEPNRISRLVVLRAAGSGEAVEFGAIVIHLSHFPQASRELILGCTLPLGTVLAQEQIPHVGRPVAFIRVEADARIGAALGTLPSRSLYGRRNHIVSPTGLVLADVVEILPG